LENLSINTLFGLLAGLLFLSACFSASETAMMAINRYRLRHAAETGHRGAMLTQSLLNRTDKLLGVILFGNNLVNIAAAMLATIISIRLFGESDVALSLATLLLTFLMLVFSEVTPKVLGSSYPERIAYPASYVLTPMLKLTYPVIWFVNLFVQGILWLLRIKPPEPGHGTRLGLEELRTIVLESSGRAAARAPPDSGESAGAGRHQRRRRDDAAQPDRVDRHRGRSRAAAPADFDQPPHPAGGACRARPTTLLGVLHVRRVLYALTGEETRPRRR
jgi:hypothetical protein